MNSSAERREVLRLAGRYRRRLAVYLAVLLVATGLEGFGLALLLPIVQAMGGESGDTIFTRYTRDLLSIAGLEFTFMNLVVIFTAVMLVKYVVVSLSQHMTRSLSAQISFDLRRQAFENLMDLPLAFFYRTKPGDLVATQYTSAQNAAAVFEYGMAMLAGVFFCGLYVVLNALISLRLTLFIVALSAVSYVLVFPRFRVGFIKGDEEKSIMDSINSYLFEIFSGIKTVKAFDNPSLHIHEYGDRIGRFRQLSVELMDNRIVASLFQEPFLFVLVVLSLVIGVEYLRIPFATLAVFLVIFIQILPKIKTVNRNWLAINEYLPHLSRVQELVGRKDKSYLVRGSVEMASLEREIRFESVSFRYPGTEENALTGISAVIERASTTALVGASGGGKTTFVDLLLRLHEPTEGTIWVDGYKLEEIHPENWHRLVGVVEQDPYLFNDTIANNVRYGKPEATEEDIIRAVKAAYAYEFIERLPDKFQTIVGNRGFRLSGGQKQRIALARALVRDPEILVLDEATSALDSEFEHLIQTAIRRLRGRMTLVVVAHRLSTIRDADKILVLEEGRILEVGRHEDLMSHKGRYRTFVDFQA